MWPPGESLIMFWPQAASKEQRAERRKRSFSPKPFLHFFLLARGGRFQGHRGPRPARFDAQGQWILTRGQGAARGPRDPQSTPPKNVPRRPSPKKMPQAKSVGRRKPWSLQISCTGPMDSDSRPGSRNTPKRPPIDPPKKCPASPFAKKNVQKPNPLKAR